MSQGPRLLETLTNTATTSEQKRVRSGKENCLFGGVAINQIYSNIQPHKRFKQLQYQININEDSAPELYIKVKNDESEGNIEEDMGE